MKFSEFVTDYDDSLSGDSYIDPLGVLVIWSAFGGQVFKSRVNSISNDVRNYTINLLNHAIIKALTNDQSITVSPALEAKIGDKNSLSFRQACLIYLENLISYTLISSKSGVDTSGVIGGSKARSKLADTKNPMITLSHKPDSQLLVSQLGLGVSGRYKTTFKTLGFFDDRYNYQATPQADQVWDQAMAFLEKCGPLHELFHSCKEHLGELIDKATKRSKTPPGSHFDDIPQTIKAACRDALASPHRVGSLTRQFWLNVTGLNQEASGALLTELKPAIQNGRKITAQNLISATLDRSKEGDFDGRIVLENIAIIEPLLAEADLLFTLACHQKNQTVQEVEALWKDYGRDDQTLPGLAETVQAQTEIKSALTGTALTRYQKLMGMAQQASLEDQLRALLDYHAQVMKQRSQLPWVAIKGGDLKVAARTSSLPVKTDRPIGCWVNNYYIPQFKNLVDGFYGSAS